MELSPNKTQEAKKLKVSVSEMLMADLMSIGYSELDAYIVAFPDKATLAKKFQDSHRTEITSKVRFRQLCEERKEKNASYLSVSDNAGDIDLISASDVAKEILLAAQKQKVGSKERADLMAKYNEIRRDNEKEIIDPNSDPVQFFFPIACEKCPLLKSYNEFLEEKNRGRNDDELTLEVRPDEMQRLIEKADKGIRRMRTNEKAGL